jgi:hypothetical protein
VLVLTIENPHIARLRNLLDLLLQRDFIDIRRGRGALRRLRGRSNVRSALSCVEGWRVFCREDEDTSVHSFIVGIEDLPNAISGSLDVKMYMDRCFEYVPMMWCQPDQVEYGVQCYLIVAATSFRCTVPMSIPIPRGMK